MWAEVMASKAVCGFEKLTKANLCDALALMGLQDKDSGNKGEMAEYLYNSISVMAKENAKYKSEVDNLLRDLMMVQDNL